MSNRSAKDDPSKQPVNLPIARIRVDERGAMHVALDGREFLPNDPATEWSRDRFGELLDVLSDHRTRAVRIEVHEYDGTVFTDIVHATRRDRAAAEPPVRGATRRPRHRTTHQLIEIRGSGFIPGEDVTVALTLSSAEGVADGTARAVVDLSHIAAQNAELMLIGRISGVIVVERLQS